MMDDNSATNSRSNRGDTNVEKQLILTARQKHGHLTFWQRSILITAILCSGDALATLSPCQAAYANINCNAGNGGNGGTAINSNGALGGIGGDCIIGGQKIFSAGGPIQNNGSTRDNQSNGTSSNNNQANNGNGF